MRRCVLFLLFLVSMCAPAAAQVVTDMTPERIAEAIREGQARNNSDDAYVMNALGRPRLTTPYSRVVTAAREAHRRYASFTAADVTAEMIRPEVDIIALSNTFGTGRPHDALTIVLMPIGRKDKAAAIHPLRTAVLKETFKNLAGAEFEGKGLVASFPIDVITEQHEIRLVYDTFESNVRLRLKKVK